LYQVHGILLNIEDVPGTRGQQEDNRS